MRRIRLVSSARGQSLMEISLLLPVLLIIVFGIIDFGLGMRSYISLSNGVREGARFAALGNPAGEPSDCDGITNTTVYGALCAATDGLDLDELEPDVTYPDGYASGNSVVVSADYSHNFVTPLGDLIGFVSGGSFPTSIELHSSTDMRIE
ncbi:MAG: pilus assembly protein [Chloroflexi bacterium]|nr:pilus assembly protein [Chloroflexota bacterium]MCI0890658.1 pilus assembly protein [Chloroflexota bacterium]